MPGAILIDDVYKVAKALGLPTRVVVERLIGGFEDVTDVDSDGVGDEFDVID